MLRLTAIWNLTGNWQVSHFPLGKLLLSSVDGEKMIRGDGASGTEEMVLQLFVSLLSLKKSKRLEYNNVF